MWVSISPTISLANRSFTFRRMEPTSPIQQLAHLKFEKGCIRLQVHVPEDVNRVMNDL